MESRGGHADDGFKGRRVSDGRDQQATTLVMVVCVCCLWLQFLGACMFVYGFFSIQLPDSASAPGQNIRGRDQELGQVGSVGNRSCVDGSPR